MRTFAIILAGCIGFLSLSQEILWVRVVSFVNQGTPQAFAEVLCLFLFGIAVGAEVGRRICERKYDLVAASAVLLLLSAAVDASAVFFRNTGPLASVVHLPALIIGSALCKSAIFPIVHHLGSLASRRGLGVSVSTIYAANIAGSTLGPLITGFVMLDRVGLHQAFLMIVMADLVLASACFAFVRSWRAMGLVAASACLLIYAFGLHPLTSRAMVGYDVKRIIENRHGIIHVVEGGDKGDAVYGGNVYDGRINTDLEINSNGVHRVYILAALHRAPKRILVIGISGGAWTKILSGFPGVERIDAVEINSGYIELMRDYAEVSDIVRDPRIHIFVDDGRRWLKRNPGKRYDLIVMNATYHWRNFSSNLLAVEFLSLLREHMHPDSILTFNTTGSMDAFKTAEAVFPHAYLYGNFVYASEKDFRVNIESGFDRIALMKWGETPVFNGEDQRDAAVIRRILEIPFKTFAEIQQGSKRPYEVITEQNMLSEYKYGRGF